MPLDQKRFNGPESSVPYRNYSKNLVKCINDFVQELRRKDGKRQDGRSDAESRPIYMKTGVVSQAKGSAYIEMNKTKVICSVFDPREIPHQNDFSENGKLFCELKFAPFSCSRVRRQYQPENDERSLSVAIKKALEPAVCLNLFPNYQVDILVYILQNDGSCLSAAINAAGLALADAAVPMYDLVTSSTIAVNGDMLFLDPTENEEIACLNAANVNHGIITLACLPVITQITHIIQVGCMTLQFTNELVNQTLKESERLIPIVKQTLLKSVSKGLEERKIMDDMRAQVEKEYDTKVEELKAKLLKT